jgi:hypothetical protein
MSISDQTPTQYCISTRHGNTLRHQISPPRPERYVPAPMRRCGGPIVFDIITMDGDVVLSWTDGSRMEERKLHKSPRQEWGKSVSFRLSSYLNK